LALGTSISENKSALLGNPYTNRIVKPNWIQGHAHVNNELSDYLL